MDGLANPLLVEALQRTREGLVDLRGRKPAPLAYEPLDTPRHVLRWEPWVRVSLLGDELLSGLSYASFSSTGVGKPDALEARIGDQRLVALTRPKADIFADQIRAVLSLATLREDRGPEILTQIDGQWAYWGTILPFRLAHTPTLVELMNVAIQFCVSVELRFKHAFACPRPYELSDAVRPLITTPGHGTFPMGHATQVEAVGVLLKHVVREVLPLQPDPAGDAHPPIQRAASFDETCDQLNQRIAENRIVAGVHYPVDHVAGIFLGRVLGKYLVHALQGQRKLPKATTSACLSLDAASASKLDAGIRAAARIAWLPANKGTPKVVLLPVVYRKALREVRVALGQDPGRS